MLVFTADPRGAPEREIIEFAETRAVTSNVRREYAVTRLLEDENVLAAICAEAGRVGDSLRAAALRDIEALTASAPSAGAWLDAYAPSVRRTMRFAAYQRSLEAIVAAGDCEAALEGIIAHYRAFGGGAGAKYVAFRREEKGLRGVERPDDIALDGLFCLDAQKRALIENTEAFLRGRPCNNVLLYGNSGCGKSSMVKALLNAYCEDGLRLAQIRREDLAELPLLLRQIRNRRLRYIVFIDDLSFESDDFGYKTLKTILDGGIEKQPENIAFYATSNRLHLISETWAERRGDEVHVRDTKNEKLSLSERFGVRVSFLSPGQREYLEIVEGILAERGMPLTEERKEEALRWAWQCNGLSGRTAAQFANALAAKAPGGSVSLGR